MKNVTQGRTLAFGAVTVALVAAAALGAQRQEVVSRLDSPRAIATSFSPCGEAIPGPKRQRALMQAQTTAGIIEGSGPNETIEVFGVSQGVVSPVDPHTGLPLGGVQRGDFTITKTLDRSSPLFMEALVEGDQVLDAEIKFYDQSGTHDYSIRLESGFVTGIETYMLKRCDGSYVHLEDISFSYRKVRYTHEIANVEYYDDRL